MAGLQELRHRVGCRRAAKEGSLGAAHAGFRSPLRWPESHRGMPPLILSDGEVGYEPYEGAREYRMPTARVRVSRGGGTCAIIEYHSVELSVLT